MLKMDQKEIIAFLTAKLSDLAAVAEELKEKIVETVPRGSVPRPRFFEFCPGIVWPGREVKEKTDHLCYDYMFVFIRRQEKAFIYLGGADARKYVAYRLGEVCSWQPRKIVRVVHQIDAAIRWARQRCNGLSQAALEVVKQQEQRR